jgi:hypothetical protein
MKYNIQMIQRMEDGEKLLRRTEAALSNFNSKQGNLIKSLETSFRKMEVIRKEVEELPAAVEKFLKDAAEANDGIQIMTVRRYDIRKREGHKIGRIRHGGPSVIQRQFEVNCLERKIDEGIGLVLSIKNRMNVLFQLPPA